MYAFSSWSANTVDARFNCTQLLVSWQIGMLVRDLTLYTA